MELLDWNQFGEWLRREGGIHSVLSPYKSYYNTIYRFFNGTGFSNALVNEYLLTIENTPTQYGKPPSNSCINWHIKVLKLLSRYLYAKNKIDVDFMKTYKLKKTAKRYVPVLEEDEQKRMIKVAYEMSHRIGVIIEVLLRHGLRVIELCQLTWSDIHRDKIYILGKGTKSRYIYPTHSLMAKFGGLKRLKNGYVFAVTEKGKPRPDTINMYVRRVARAAKIEEYLTVHLLRHTSGTTKAASGVSDFIIQKEYGHTDIRTTQIYIHPTISMMKKASYKHPLETEGNNAEMLLQELESVYMRFIKGDLQKKVLELRKITAELLLT